MEMNMYDQNIPLHQAVCIYYFKGVCKILNKDPSCVNDWDLSFETPLHLLYKNDFSIEKVNDDKTLQMTQLLLDYKANVNIQSETYDETPLHNAIKQNKRKIIELLLESGADPNLRDFEDNTPLHYALMYQFDVEIIKLLLNKGADPNAVNNQNEAPLTLSIPLHSLEVTQVLLDAGAKTYDIHAMLISACVQKNEQMMKFLLKNSSELNGRSQFCLKSVYFKVSTDAAMNEVENRFFDKILDELGVDVNDLKKGGMEMTDLHLAVHEENEESLRTQLKEGADVNTQNLIGDTPLHHLMKKSCLNRHIVERMARLLMDFGADLDAQNYDNYTPFQLAAKGGSTSLVNLMLAKKTGVDESTLKSDISLKKWLEYHYDNDLNLYELAVAIILGYENVVDRLIGRGCKNELGSAFLMNTRSPLYFAIETERYDIAKILLEADFRIDGHACNNITSVMLSNENESNLEFICLLWEFNCISVIRKLLAAVLKSVINDSVLDGVTYLFVFYYAIEMRSKRLRKEFISVKGVFSLNLLLFSVLTSCNNKLEKLKKNMVCEGFSEFDLLHRKLDSVVAFLNNEQNLDAFQRLHAMLESKPELELEQYVVKVRVSLALEKRELLNLAKENFDRSFQGILKPINLISLPDEILQSILSYLNMRELRKLANKFISSSK